MDFTFPASDLDEPDALLEALGSFWHDTYQGGDTVGSILTAVAASASQTLRDYGELRDSLSRHQVPVLHLEQSYPWLISQSQLGQGYDVPEFDDGRHAFNDGTLFDQAQATALSAYPAPANLITAPLIVNQLTGTTRILVSGVDFWLQGGLLLFRTDPFADPLFPQQQVLQNNQVTDNQITLWILRAGLDRQYLNNLFAYALNLSLPSAQASKDLVNALLDGLVEGTAQKHLRTAWSAITGVPLAGSDGETVQLVQSQPNGSRLLVITDKRVYSFDPSAEAVVSAGDTVSQYDPLTDALLFYEFNQGQAPSPADVPGLSLSRGFLTAGFFADLMFLNKEVPTTVGSDADGYTTLTFEVDGFPGDVELFFELLQSRGRAAGHTLAQLLDTRPVAARDTEPTALSLPATINPLAFLCQNVLRSNVQLVKLRTSACLGGAGMQSAKALRMLVPPQAAVIVLALTSTDDSITMDGAGGPQGPGYLESVSSFVGNSFSESIDSSYFSESVRLFQVGSRCV